MLKEIDIGAGERVDKINENITIIQKKHGPLFGTDTYLLAAYIRRGRIAEAVDLGSGSGAAALICAAREKFGRIWAIELQDQQFELIGRNAALNLMGDRIKPIHLDVREADASLLGYEVAAVISNPPYMRADCGKLSCNNAKNIARHEFAGTIVSFCEAASRLLRQGGRFYCVYRPERAADLFEAMRIARLEPKRITFVHPYADKPASLMLAEAVKDGAAGVKITPPLVIYSGNERIYTEEMRQIYDSCYFPDRFY